MKKIALGVLAAGFAIAACGGSTGKVATQNASVQTTTTTAKSSAARRTYDGYMKKYQADIAEFAAAFSADTSTPAPDPWVTTVTGACAPADPSSDGMAMAILSPVLARHGHDYVQFKTDTNKLDAQIRDEGLCASVTTTTNAMTTWNAAVDEWNALTQKRDATGAKTVVVDGRSFDDYAAWASANGKPLTSP